MIKTIKNLESIYRKKTLHNLALRKSSQHTGHEFDIHETYMHVSSEHVVTFMVKLI